MTTKTNRSPVYSLDHDGTAIVLVPLANHPVPAKLLKDDFNSLRELGLSDQWTANLDGSRSIAYVRSAANVPGHLVTVARLITGAGRGRRVRYRDGDRFNLRRDNLCVTEGFAKKKTVLPSADITTSEDRTQLSHPLYQTQQLEPLRKNPGKQMKAAKARTRCGFHCVVEGETVPM